MTSGGRDSLIVSLVIIAARWHLAIIEGAVVLLALQAT